MTVASYLLIFRGVEVCRFLNFRLINRGETNRITFDTFLSFVPSFLLFLFRKNKEEDCSLNLFVPRDLYDLNEYVCTCLNVSCICIYICASIKHRTNIEIFVIVLPLDYTCHNNCRIVALCGMCDRCH